MCLINFQFNNHPKYKLIIVANRDEDYARPSAAAHFWDDEPMILGGRDLLQMGTWLGVSKEGRFAAITNFRDPKEEKKPKSRGEIVKDFLSKNVPIGQFIECLQINRELYGGYNVLLSDGEQLFHYNNRLDEVNKLLPGTHSLSNYSLNTPWPKVVKAKKSLKEYLDIHKYELNIDRLFEIVSDQTIAEDKELPNTGVGIELERLLSPIFIKMPNYGTRTSTVVLMNHNNNVTFVERTFRGGQFQFETSYEFEVNQK